MFDSEVIDTLVRKPEIEMAEGVQIEKVISGEVREQFATLESRLRDLTTPLNARLDGVGRLAVVIHDEEFVATFYSARYHGGHYIKGAFEVRLTPDSQVTILMRIHGRKMPSETLAFDRATSERLDKRMRLFVDDCLRAPSQSR